MSEPAFISIGQQPEPLQRFWLLQQGWTERDDVWAVPGSDDCYYPLEIALEKAILSEASASLKQRGWSEIHPGHWRKAGSGRTVGTPSAFAAEFGSALPLRPRKRAPRRGRA